VTVPDLVAMNATMTRKILAEPAQPLVENGYALRVVHTTGRRSGERRSTPIGVVQIDGRLYLISPDRSRAWVHNLDADPACTLDPGDDDRIAVPAPPAEAAPAISAYLTAMQVPWALRAFPVGPEASLDEITAHLDSLAVYRLDPR
jgi:deazaflavin-dependent oxidoreductase (nitroreductase family)